MHERQKERSSHDIYNNLANLRMRKMANYFTTLKIGTTDVKKETLKKFLTVSRSLNNKTREYFQRWQKCINNNEVVRECNEEGPIREEVFD